MYVILVNDIAVDVLHSNWCSFGHTKTGGIKKTNTPLWFVTKKEAEDYITTLLPVGHKYGVFELVGDE